MCGVALGIILGKCLTSLLQYGKVYAWLASTNHNQPRTVNRLFASPVRFLPITGCASVMAFCSAPFLAVCLLRYARIVYCSKRCGIFLCLAKAPFKIKASGYGFFSATGSCNYALCVIFLIIGTKNRVNTHYIVHRPCFLISFHFAQQ